MKSPTGRLAFVSDNGLVVGVGEREFNDPRTTTGKAVAILFNPTSIQEWAAVLVDNPELDDAIEAIVVRLGGMKINRPIPMTNATFISGGVHNPPAEA